MSRVLIRVVGTVAFYLAASAALVYLNDRFLGTLEFGWPWYWLLWGVLFAPPIAVLMVASLVEDFNTNRLRITYMASVLIVLAAMELSFVFDLGLGIVTIVVVTLCLGCYGLIRLSTR